MSELSVEQKAKELGWSPKEHFKGDPEKWIDAETYVKRGEELMPILRANNTKLLGEVSTLRGELSTTRSMLKEASESIDALKEFNNSATIKGAKEQRSKLAAELKEARDAGDTDKEIEITDKLEEVREEIKKAEEKPVKKTNGDSNVDDPAFVAWRGDNPWYGQDKRRTNVSIAIANELRQDPANKGLTGKPFLDMVSAELEKTFPSEEKPRGRDKVEGGGRNSGGGGENEAGKTFADLPSDVKSTCDRQAGRLVGPNRAFKDLNAWRNHYAVKYFEE